MLLCWIKITNFFAFRFRKWPKILILILFCFAWISRLTIKHLDRVSTAYLLEFLFRTRYFIFLKLQKNVSTFLANPEIYLARKNSDVLWSRPMVLVMVHHRSFGRFVYCNECLFTLAGFIHNAFFSVGFVRWTIDDIR